MGRSRSSTNSHATHMKTPSPHIARLYRAEPFRAPDEAELKVTADRIAGPAGWSAVAGWSPADVDSRLIHFATLAEAEEMQRWIGESGIETRQGSALGNSSCGFAANDNTRETPRLLPPSYGHLPTTG